MIITTKEQMEEYQKNFWLRKLQELSQIHGEYTLLGIEKQERLINEELRLYETYRYIFQDGYKFSYDTEIGNSEPQDITIKQTPNSLEIVSD